jgi:hypothetical protein
MKSGLWMSLVGAVAAVVVGATAASMGAAAPLAAQAVTFSEIDDAMPGMFFDPATTAPDPLNPQRLVIGLHTGTDPQTWMSREFTASTAAFYRRSAMETLSLTIEAPDGQYISKITYNQVGSGSVIRTGAAGGGSQWVVDGEAFALGQFATNPTLTGSVDLSSQKKTRVPVSITTSLFAFSTPQLGSATLKVTGAEVVVEVQPLQP